MSLRRIVAALAAAAGLSILAGALVGLAVFRAWGLDFLQVAAPADVVMAGLKGLVGVLPSLALFAAGAILWRGRGPVAAVLCLAGLGALYGLVVLPAQGAAARGFYGRTDWVIDGGTGGCAVAKVYWTGQNAVVYQCMGAGDRRFRVSFDRSSMTLLPAAHAGELVRRM